MHRYIPPSDAVTQHELPRIVTELERYIQHRRICVTLLFKLSRAPAGRDGTTIWAAASAINGDPCAPDAGVNAWATASTRRSQPREARNALAEDLGGQLNEDRRITDLHLDELAGVVGIVGYLQQRPRL